MHTQTPHSGRQLAAAVPRAPVLAVSQGRDRVRVNQPTENHLCRMRGPSRIRFTTNQSMKNTPANPPASARARHPLWVILATMLSLSCAYIASAEPPSHDPSRIIQNTDGRYWVFTTGAGIWTMSSSNPQFTDWRAENTVFPVGTWPSWINSYVSGFGGTFWAPDVIKMGSYFYCYYSCAGNGAPAAIGVARASNLSGPWTDLGRIVNGNNCIDPAILQDGSNMYMSYGNWQSGIDLIQLSTSTGLRSGSSLWRLIPNQQVEAPYIIKNGSYYYLFFQRGLCCNGCNSTYYVQVGRSSSVTGPYVDKNGTQLGSGGGTTFLPNLSGYQRGPGHIGYGAGRLTYHFYNMNASCAAQLGNTTLSWGSDGWPVAGSGGGGGTTYYKLRNRTTALCIDGMGLTANGANCGQYASNTSYNQQWAITATGSYVKLQNRGTGLCLDGMGRTASGSVAGQWASSSSYNQQWTQSTTSGYYKYQNRATGLYLDGVGRTANGSDLGQYSSSTSNNQQFSRVTP
jgi:arabinan endo-1,5-alpha-L-arabinosidase